MTAPGRRASLAPALVTIGFAALALGGILALLALSSSELENPAQAAMWSSAGGAVGGLGALLAVVGALLGARQP